MLKLILIQYLFTPLGWSYNSSQLNHSINLKLNEALLAVHHRNQTVPIDGIYSILGLLSYCDKVLTKYKDNLCKECKNLEQELQKTIVCLHEDALKTEFPTYFRNDLEYTLQDVIKTALQNGYSSDVFSWFGPRNSQLLPLINEKGNFEVKNLIEKEDFELIKNSIVEINENIIHFKDASVMSLERFLKQFGIWKFFSF